MNINYNGYIDLMDYNGIEISDESAMNDFTYIVAKNKTTKEVVYKRVFSDDEILKFKSKLIKGFLERTTLKLFIIKTCWVDMKEKGLVSIPEDLSVFDSFNFTK